MNILLMYQPSPAHLAALQAAAPEATFLVARDEPSAARLIADSDAVLGNRYFLQSLPYARRLRWMQSNSVGVDLILRAGVELGNLVLTCAKGVYDDEVADHALALLLSLTRGIHLVRDDQRERRWQRHQLRTLAGTRCLVLGWGGIGQAIASRLAVFGARVEGVRRHSAGKPVRHGEFLIRGPHDWRSSLPDTDLLIMTLPITAETHHLVGAAELAALPSHAFVVNIGRGRTLDDVALLTALQQGRLGGAALDTFEIEPLPADHPMWSEPKLLVSPHAGRSLESPPFRWEPLFVENLRRFAAGEPLLNVVDREAGY